MTTLIIQENSRQHVRCNQFHYFHHFIVEQIKQLIIFDPLQNHKNDFYQGMLHTVILYFFCSFSCIYYVATGVSEYLELQMLYLLDLLDVPT